MKLKTTIKVRTGTSGEWLAATTPLQLGEPGYNVDTKEYKIGDGVSLWSSLPKAGQVTKEEIGLGNVDNVQQYSASNPPPYPVTSVNGQIGAVTVDSETLGLGDLAKLDTVSHGYIASSAVETSKIAREAVTGEKIDAGAIKAGDNITVTRDGSNNFVISSTSAGGVTSVNGLTGEVTLTASTLGLGALASKNVVGRGDLGSQCVGAEEIRNGSVGTDQLASSCVNAKKLASSAVETAKIANGAVTGEKLSASVVKAGANISVTRDGANNFIVATDLTTGVSSVNGETGDVTVDKQSLGLGALTSDRQFPFATSSPTDFNDMGNGVYVAIGSSSHICTHFPLSLDNISGSTCVWFVFAVSSADGTHRAQLAVSGKEDGAVCARSCTSGSWSAWKEIGV